MTTFNSLTKAILTSVITLFIYAFATAQCNPNIIIVPGQTCQDAASTCNFNGYCGDMQAGNWGGDASFCSGGFSLQNPHWFSFVASANVINFDIELSNCSGGNGIAQWGLIDNCDNLNNVLLCNGNGVGSGGIINIHYNEAIPGNTYCIVLDGSSGSTCHYEFSNVTGTIDGSVGEIKDTILNGDPYICPQFTLDYSFAGFENASSYTWTLDDFNLGANLTPNIQFQVPQLPQGTYQLCAHATNDCDSIGKTKCWDLVLDTARTLEVTLFTCVGDSVFYQDRYYQIGDQFIDYLGFNTCARKVDLHVRAYEIPQDSTITIYLCPGETSYEVNGNTYLIDSLYENIDLETNFGCRYLGKAIFKLLDTSEYKIVASIDPFPCINIEPSILSFEGQLISGSISYSIKWYNSAGQQVGSGLTYPAKKPGNYYMILTQNYKNNGLFGDTNTHTCIIRLDYFIKNSTPITIDPIINQSNTNPPKGKYTLNIANESDFVQGMNFKWIIPNGIGYSILNPTIANLTFPQNGTYTICAYATDGCTVSDTICVEIIASEISGTKSYDNSGLELKGNPVSSELIFEVKSMNGKKLDIDILSIYGNRIKSQSLYVENGSIVIDVNQLIPGTYIYHIRADKSSISTGKFVKM